MARLRVYDEMFRGYTSLLFGVALIARICYSVVVPQSPVVHQSLNLDCTIQSPIIFESFSVGSSVTSGEGFTLETLRVRDGLKGVSAVIDSANPPAQDEDLGAPNSACVGSGPGKGEAGRPGSPGENCQPLGKILVAHEGNITALRTDCSECPNGSMCKDCIPNDAMDGGEFVFTFNETAVLHDVVMLDVDESTGSFSITLPGGNISLYHGFGHNGKQTISLNNTIVKPGGILKLRCTCSCALISIGRTMCAGLESSSISESRTTNISPSSIVSSIEPSPSQVKPSATAIGVTGKPSSSISSLPTRTATIQESFSSNPSVSSSPSLEASDSTSQASNPSISVTSSASQSYSPFVQASIAAVASTAPIESIIFSAIIISESASPSKSPESSKLPSPSPTPSSTTVPSPSSQQCPSIALPSATVCAYIDACNKKRITALAGGSLIDSCPRSYCVGARCGLSLLGTSPTSAQISE